MDSRQDDFFITRINELLWLTRPHETTRPWDDTERTEIVTAFLNFQRSPCPVRKGRYIQFFIDFCFHDVSDRIDWHAFFTELFNVSNHFMPILCSDDDIDARNRHDFSRRCLGITARYADDTIRILANRPSDDLATFLISGIRDRTCIDDINVRMISKINACVTSVLEQLPDSLCFVMVDFTAKRLKGNSCHFVHPFNSK